MSAMSAKFATKFVAKHVMTPSPHASKAALAPRGALLRCTAVRISLGCVLALLGSLPLHAAPGDRDTTFGTDGFASFSFLGFSARAIASASALQANGKLTIAGRCESAQAIAVRACVLRMTPSGEVDASFGSAGQVTTAAFGVDDVWAGISTIDYQGDGRLLLGGRCNTNSGNAPCVMRLQANGAVDTSFGVQGVVTLSDSTWGAGVPYVRSIQPLQDGRIALGVDCRRTASSDHRFCAALLQSSGAPDPNFGVGGAVRVEAETSLGESQILTTAAIDEAGGLVIAGMCFGASLPRANFCAVRLQPNGVRDSQFGTNGAFILDVGGNGAVITQAVLRPDGGMLIGARCLEPSTLSTLTCLAAMTPEGSKDRAFGTDGYSVLSFNRGEYGLGLFAQSLDGSIVAAYECSSAITDSDFCLRQLRSDGTQGSATRWPQDERPYTQSPISVAVDAQGRIVVSGSCRSSHGSNFNHFCAARYEGGPYANTMCSFDLDGDGRVDPSVDGLILLRAALGFSGASIVQGVTFPEGAKRTVWGGSGADDLRHYLAARCGMQIAPVPM